MSKPYKDAEIDLDAAFVKKLSVKGRIVAVLDLKIEKRTLQLIEPASRALKRNDICELVVTNNETVKPGSNVKNTKYLCFFEVVHGGIALHGDTIVIGDENKWELKGFNRTHMPNHLNIVASSEKWKTGKEMELYLNQEVKIVRTS